MPETKYIEVYREGTDEPVLVDKIPYEVSDEELERERAEQTIRELSVLSDTELTTTKIRKLLKALARLRR